MEELLGESCDIAPIPLKGEQNKQKGFPIWEAFSRINACVTNKALYI